MELFTKTPRQFTQQEIDAVARLAGLGFGQGASEAMRQDTYNHIVASDTVQLAYSHGELVAFAMTRSCLWR